MMDPSSRLTWYPGSILPYTSLWLTLMRVTSLNRLRVEQVNWLVSDPSSTHGLRSNTTWFRNCGSEACIARLSQMLGEPPEAFRWSTAGYAPAWARELFSDTPRVCRQCLEKGYHSGLFALRLLEECPIHGCAFMEHCQCGANFPDRLSAIDCMSDGVCRCGKLGFFTAETCRRPLADPEMTRPLEPVVAWLSGLSNTLRVKQIGRVKSRSKLPEWSRSIAYWSALLEMDYPGCFAQLETRRLSVSWHRGSHQIKEKSALLQGWTPKQIHQNKDGGLTIRQPSALYSSLSRHIRKHLAVNAHVWIRRFQASADPLEIAKLMGESREAFMAFAYMLWVRETDPQREWKFSEGRGSMGQSSAGAQEGPAHASMRCSKRRPEIQAIQWLDDRVTIATLFDLWHTALDRAFNALTNGCADWTALNCVDLLPEVVAQRSNDGALGVLELRAQRSLPAWAEGSRRTKQDRILSRKLSFDQRLARVMSESPASGFEWAGEGWTKAKLLMPDEGPMRTLRLFKTGWPSHPVWLYRSGSQFVVQSRLVGAQTKGNSMKAAFASMRMLVYENQPPFLTLRMEPSRLVQALPTRKNERAKAVFKANLAMLLRDAGFWSASEIVKLHVKTYLSEVEGQQSV